MDRVGLGSLVPVEYFGNKEFEFLPDNKSVQRFEVCESVLLLFRMHLKKMTHFLVCLGYDLIEFVFLYFI